MADETEPTLRVKIITEADAAPMREVAQATTEATAAAEKLVETTARSTAATEKEAVALDKDAAAAHRASEEFKRLEAARKITDLSGPGVADSMSPEEIAAADARRRAGKPSVGGALLTPLPDLAAAPRAVDNVDEQIRGLRENTLAAKHELDDLLNRPGERTRKEIETITELQGVLRANAQEARQFAGGASSPLVAAQLFALAKQADATATIQSAYRARQSSAAGETTGLSGAEAGALGAGLRSTGAAGGFLTGSLARAASSVGLLRIALWGLAGAGIGTVVAAIGGLIGYFAKGAAGTKEWQDAVTTAKASTGEFGAELARTTKPVTDFLGKIGGKTLDFFSGEVDKARGAMARLNNELGRPDNESARRALEQMAKDAQSLATNLDGVAAAAARMNREVDASNAKVAGLFGAKNRRVDAKLGLDLSDVDVAEGEGKYTPEQAEAERQRLRTAAEEAKIRNDLKSIAAQKVQADAQAESAARESSAAAEKLRQRESELARMQALPPPADEGARKARNEQLAAVGDEVQKAQGAVDAIRKGAQEARDNAEALGEELLAKNLELQVAARASAAERAKLEKEETRKRLEEELNALGAAHKLRMAQIEEAGTAERQVIAETAAARSKVDPGYRPPSASDRKKTRGKSSPAEKRSRTLAKENARRETAQAKLKSQRETDAALLAEQEDFLRRKLALEDKLGEATGESDEARGARYDEANAELVRARSKAARAETALTQARAGSGSAWGSGIRAGRIDGRSQRTRDGIYDPDGGDIIEEQGVARFGRDAMGRALSGSRLGPSIGPVPLRSKPGADAARDRVGQPVKEAGDAVKTAVKEVTTEAVSALTDLKAEVVGLKGPVVDVINDLRREVADLTSRVNNQRSS